MTKRPRVDSANWMLRSVGIALAPIILIGVLFATGNLPIFGQDSITAKTNLPANLDNVYAQYEHDVIELKFDDALQMRLRDGTPQNMNDDVVSTAEADALSALSAGGAWKPSHTVSVARLDELRINGEARTGQTLPDLNNYMRLILPPGMGAVEAVAQFAELESVAKAFLIPKPAPIADVIDYATPGNVSGNRVTDPYQGYLDPAPDGVDARWAWEGINGDGGGMRICDVEYDYNATHEDLPTVNFVGDPKDPPFSNDHGTTVLSIMGGRPNAWGVKGIAFDAKYFFAAAKTTTGGYDVGNGVIECMGPLGTGDVIIIEQQTGGPNYNASDNSQFGLVPVEWFEPWYDDIKTAVANGMVVVEAGGNGSQDLDSSDYANGNGNHYPFKSANDSGALIVGAGKPPKQGVNARSAESFSSYGSTVDIQGWGSDLVSAGYGDLYPGGASPDAAQRNLWFRRSFGGTSGASPMVAASAAIVQANYKAKDGSPASPAKIKETLRDTGTAQSGSKNIGPLPNLRAAIQKVWGVSPATVAPPTIDPGGGTYAMPMQVTIDYGSASQNSGNTHLRYTLNGNEPTIDSFIIVPEFGDTIYLNYGVTIKAKAFQSDVSTGLVNSSETASATYVSSTPKVETPVINPGGGIYSQPHQVVITTGTPGATIRYRTDGRNISFFYPGTDYTGPITLDPGTYEITAKAYKDGYYKSDLAASGQVTVNPLTLPAPVIYPNGGQFSGSVTVYLGSTVLGADIRYTTDGSEPSPSSPQFAEPIVLTQSATVKARIYLEGYTPSPVIEKAFTVTTVAETPVITPVSGTTATGSLEVSMSTATSSAIIRYTTNGAEPTSYSTAYSGPFTLGVGEHTVKAKAFLAGANASPTATAEYSVYSVPLAKADAPVIDPSGGNHTGEITVTLTTATEGADIYYIIDSANPPNQLYSGPITLPVGATYSLRSQAKKSDTMADSDISTTSFTIFDPSLTGTIEVPDVTPPSGVYTDTVQVTVDGHTNPSQFRVRQVYVTTDGDDPRPNSNSDNRSSPYNFTVSKSTKVKAIATQLGWYDSAVVTRNYTVQCALPTISPPTDVLTATVDVSLDTSTPNATIRYTLDGAEPDESSTEYSSSFQLGVGTHTVKAKCFRTNFEDSPTATQVYIVNETPVAPQIVTQPVDRTVNVGTDATFSVTVSGEPYPDIRWQKDGVDIAGEVEPDLVIADAQPGNAGQYRALASNSAGEVTSDAATLTVEGTPTPTLTPTLIPTETVTVEPPTPTATSIAGGVDTDVAINEVYYRGSGSDDWVEIINTGSDTIDIGDWWLCARFQYGKISSLTLLVGSDYVLSPGEILVVQAHTDLDNNASDLGLYTTNDFASTAAMVDFVQWGTGQDVGRSDVAEAKGIWRQLSPGQYDFVSTAADGQSTAWLGTNSGGGLLTFSSDWTNGAPTKGLSNDTPTETPTPAPTPTFTPTSMPGFTPIPTPTSTPGASGADTDIAINEVYYLGDSADDDWVEIINTGSDVIDISEWWLCARFEYGQINTLDLISGSDYVLGPGEILAVKAHANLDNNSSDLGLYTTNDFANAQAMVDFVQWGTGQDVGRADVAEAKGIWRQLSPGQYDFVSTASAGQSTAWLGTNSGGGLLTFSSDWTNQTPTQGSDNASIPVGDKRVYLPITTK